MLAIARNENAPESRRFSQAAIARSGRAAARLPPSPFGRC